MCPVDNRAFLSYSFYHTSGWQPDELDVNNKSLQIIDLKFNLLRIRVPNWGGKQILSEGKVPVILKV